MTQMYKRWRVGAIMIAILVVVLADHLRSPTFAFNMGQGTQTTLMQRDLGACAPCGAPCPSARK
jgi:hypothetical protein